MATCIIGNSILRITCQYDGVEIAQRMVNEVPIESVFTDFRDVSGVQFPFTIESFIEGKLVQQMKITSREANVKIEEARFVMPGSSLLRRRSNADQMVTNTRC